MNKSVADIFRLALIFVPTIALLSANLYFYILSQQVDILTANLFGLQDHFDKAVDLIAPVFVLFSFTVLFSKVTFDKLFSNSVKNHVSKLKHSHTRIALVSVLVVVPILLGVATIIILPFERIAIFIPLFVVGLGPLLTLWLAKIANRHLGWEKKSSYELILFGVLLASYFVVGIIIQCNGTLAHAKSRYFKENLSTILEETQLGVLMVEEGNYVIKKSDGTNLIEGRPINPVSTSIGCRSGWIWSCRWNIDYRTTRDPIWLL